MPTYVQIYDNAYPSIGGALWKQTAVAVGLLATRVFTEPPSTPSHELRLAWARRVLENPLVYLLRSWPAISTILASKMSVDAGGKPVAMSDEEVYGLMDLHITVFL